jgi:SAM-dependent methyltransferase
VYDRWARVYDWNPALALVRPARERAVAALDLAPGDTAVDMGTGTGANLPLLRRAVGQTGQVVGIDLSPAMLERARRRIETNGWDNVSVVEGDVLDPPLDGPVDAITSGFLMVMYDDPARLIEAWIDRLADGGGIANVYAGPSDRWYAAIPDGLLGAYLRLFESGWVSADQEGSQLSTIAERGQRARSTLADRAETSVHESRAFGLAHVDVGRFGSG